MQQPSTYIYSVSSDKLLYFILVRHLEKAKFVPPSDDRNSSVRILFFLPFFKRDIRLVRRLLKAIYHPHHYYVMHIDARPETDLLQRGTVYTVGMGI